ncbi:protein geranylgeranyltransferase type I [Salvia divinorum]|uniref:Protein geranylgeranyltransferase type I n=1 Tax=Salvia divinorum TaxID=28513 RepID=A0ABD1GDV7_SALDI
MEDEGFWDFDSESLSFEKDRHILYLEMMYQLLPAPYQGQEINRLTLAYFVISGLDIFAALDRVSPTSPILLSFFVDDNARIIVI